MRPLKYLTKQCQLILAILEKQGHATAEEVYEEAVKTMPRIALGTVYRNLSDLSREGRIKKIAVSDGPDRFDITVKQHEHIICPNCQKVIDLSVAGLDTALSSALGNLQREDYQYDLTVRALCADCRGK